jgi:hypothetical protein
MLSAFRRCASQPATFAGMCGLACHGATASSGTSSLHARRITHLISLTDFAQQQRLSRANGPLLPQQPSLASRQQPVCRSSAQRQQFAAAAIPQMARDVTDAAASAPSRRRRRSGDALPTGSAAEMAVVERLQQLAFKKVQGATTDGAAATSERQPDRKQRPSDSQPEWKQRPAESSGSGSKRKRSKRRRGVDTQHSGASDRQQSPAALRPGKDPHAIRSPSLIRNSDIPSHAWAVMRTLKDAGEAAVLCLHRRHYA